MLTACNRRSLRSEQLAFRLSPHHPRRRRRNPEVHRWPPKDDAVFNAVVPPGAMWRWTNTDSWTRVTAACRRLARLGATDVGNLGLSQLAPKKKSPIKHRNFLGQQHCFSQSAPFLFLEKSCIFCIMELPNTLFLVVTVIFMLLHFRRDSSLIASPFLAVPPLSLSSSISLLSLVVVSVVVVFVVVLLLLPLLLLLLPLVCFRCRRCMLLLLWYNCCCVRFLCSCCHCFFFVKKIIIFAKISLLLTSRC